MVKLLFLLLLLPTIAFANADGINYKDATVIAKLVPDEASAYTNEEGVKVYQTLKLDLPFKTYCEEYLTPIDLRDLKNEGKSVVVNIHYSCKDIGAEKRVKDESAKVENFLGILAMDKEAQEIKIDPVKLEAKIATCKIDAATKAEMVESVKTVEADKLLAEVVDEG